MQYINVVHNKNKKSFLKKCSECLFKSKALRIFVVVVFAEFVTELAMSRQPPSSAPSIKLDFCFGS